MNCRYGNVKVVSYRRRSSNKELVLGLELGLGLGLGLYLVLE